jgi:Xaa-Pro aminopeptidase
MSLIRIDPSSSREFNVMDTPSHPDVPYSEWKERIGKVKRLMAERGIDVLVLFEGVNVRYFFGYQTIHWNITDLQPAVGIIPVDQNPVLITPDFLTGNAQAFGWARDLILWEKPHEVPAQRAFPKELATVLKDMGYGNKAIALEMGRIGYMYIPRPLNDIETFKNALPEARFVDGDEVIWGCRMIKSALEIERLREATQVVKRMHATIVEEFRPGMSEMDIQKIVCRVAVEAGDFQGMDDTLCTVLCCGRGKEGIIDALGIENVILNNRDDYIVADLVHRHKGYWADMARIFQIGPVTEKMHRFYDICAEGMKAAIASLKPGVRANEVFRTGVKPLEDAGIPGAVELIGHGIGMDIHEPPVISANNEMVLEENMYLSLEVWAFDGGWRKDGGGGIFGIEDHYVITDKGCEKIEGLDWNVRQVRHFIS